MSDDEETTTCQLCGAELEVCTAASVCIAGQLTLKAVKLEELHRETVAAMKEGLESIEALHTDFEAMREAYVEMDAAMRSAIDTLATFRVRMAVDPNMTADRMALVAEAMAILNDALPTPTTTEGETPT